MSNKQDRFISAHNVTSSWINAVSALMEKPKQEAFNLAVRIEKPTIEILSQRKTIERYLTKPKGKLEKEHIETVAQTIFPRSRLHYTCSDPTDSVQRKKFYDDYMRDKDFIRAFNLRGTYFQRMINWPSWDSKNGINQIENIIKKINSRRASRVVHELSLENHPDKESNFVQLYNPEEDRKFKPIMGFPCLSYISIKPESVKKTGGKIHMTALYRNHHFFSRAYGNYLGLGWLLKFIADSTRKDVGELLCVSSMATLDSSSTGIAKNKIKEMLRELKSSED